MVYDLRISQPTAFHITNVPFDHHQQVLVCLTNLWYIRCTGFNGMEMVQVTPLRRTL